MTFVRTYGVVHAYMSHREARVLFSSVLSAGSDSMIDDAALPAVMRQSSSSSAEGVDDRMLSFRQFCEFIVGCSFYVIRNPYLAAAERLDRFVAGWLNKTH